MTWGILLSIDEFVLYITMGRSYDLGNFVISTSGSEQKKLHISSLHAERNGTSHSFIPPTTAVKKLKAPRKHPPKLMNLCCISQWEGRMKLGIVPLKSV